MSKDCTNCNGEGGWYDTRNEWIMCNDCMGSGRIYDDDETGQNGFAF